MGRLVHSAGVLNRSTSA